METKRLEKLFSERLHLELQIFRAPFCHRQRGKSLNLHIKLNFM